ncbi:MAG TPA: hypothetical protein VHU92_14155 [Streptosporangiaceae bacterium]|nr:hypothetical protein [Streptosporangiaceae bacterium]
MNGAVNRDYDDILRRALHAAAESVEPSADGLERIRERLGRPPLLSFSSIAGWYSVAAVRFTGWAVPALGTACEIFWALIDRFRPLDSPPGHAKPGLRWLRPLTATGLAIFVVAAGAFAALAIPRITASPTSDAGHTTHNGGSGGGPGRSTVRGSSPIHSNSGSPGYSSGTSSSPTAATKCHRIVSPTSSTTPSPGTSNSSVPTTTSPTPTPTSTSPSPSTSTSPSPSTSDTSPSQPSSGTTGTPASAQASSAATSASPGASSSSPGSASPSGAVSPGANNPAGRDQTAGPVGSSSLGLPCPSSSPSSTATHKLVHTMGLGQPILVISSDGHYVLPAGRGTF